MDSADMTQLRDEKGEAERLRHLRMTVGMSPFACYRCGKIIPEKRRIALPGTPYCITCAKEREEES